MAHPEVVPKIARNPHGLDFDGFTWLQLEP